MLSDIEIKLLEDYQNNTITESDKRLLTEKYFENNGNNPFAEALKVYQTIDLILDNDPITAARFYQQQQKTGGIPTSHDLPPQAKTYTLDELTLKFAPLPQMERANAVRGAINENMPPTLQSLVVLPLDGIDCNKSLYFSLDQPIPSPLTCTIFNNRSIKSLEQTVEANAISFEVPLSLPLGRYYWQLTPSDRQVRNQLDSAIGMFFVNKKLMPDTITS